MFFFPSLRYCAVFAFLHQNSTRSKTMSGQKAVIVGGTTGMGLATAHSLAAAGYKVVITGRSLESIQKAIATFPATSKNSVEGQVLNFGNTDQIKACFAAVGAFDHLLLVGSADVAWGPFASIPKDKFRTALDSKLVAYAEVTQLALPTINSLNTSSITYVAGGAARQAMPGTAFLAAVNGGIICMARTLAKELAPIRVNVVSPGLVDTPAYDQMPPAHKKGMFDSTAKALPVGKVGSSEEIADCLHFVVRSGFTTGAVIDIDGGSRLK